VFAASAVLWEMLVGRRLFDGDSQAAIVSAVLGEPIDPPGVHRPEVPEELDELVLRGLDRDPKRRPRTALELAVALERVVAPAGPAVIGEWVTTLAREELERREEIVRRIESGVDDTVAVAPARARSSRARWPFVLAIVALAATSGAVAMKTRPEPRSGGSFPPSTPAPPSTTVTAGEALPVAIPSLSSPPPSSSTAPTSVPGARPKPRGSAMPSTSARRCDPPYDLDPAGRKIFRVECL
jgi:serine/threonine protein kinase